MFSAMFLPLLLVLLPFSTAQFQFFEHMFGGGPQQHYQRQPQDVRSDSDWYRENYERAHCSKYLCERTLSCVDKPSHCPCAFPSTQDKVELGDGIAICASKGGYLEDEMAMKVDLARRGLI